MSRRTDRYKALAARAKEINHEIFVTVVSKGIEPGDQITYTGTITPTDDLDEALDQVQEYLFSDRAERFAELYKQFHDGERRYVAAEEQVNSIVADGVATNKRIQALIEEAVSQSKKRIAEERLDAALNDLHAALAKDLATGAPQTEDVAASSSS